MRNYINQSTLIRKQLLQYCIFCHRLGKMFLLSKLKFVFWVPLGIAKQWGLFRTKKKLILTLSTQPITYYWFLTTENRNSSLSCMIKMKQVLGYHLSQKSVLTYLCQSNMRRFPLSIFINIRDFIHLERTENLFCTPCSHHKSCDNLKLSLSPGL